MNIFEKDVNKYSCKKITDPIINHNNKKLDILCFPDVFPYGSNGMYEDREYEVKPAMFIRNVIFNEVPTDRRNMQYVFSSINNKDIYVLLNLVSSLR